jgi:hypothetical protein
VVAAPRADRHRLVAPRPLPGVSRPRERLVDRRLEPIRERSMRREVRGHLNDHGPRRPKPHEHGIHRVAIRDLPTPGEALLQSPRRSRRTCARRAGALAQPCGERRTLGAGSTRPAETTCSPTATACLVAVGGRRSGLRRGRAVRDRPCGRCLATVRTPVSPADGGALGRRQFAAAVHYQGGCDPAPC